jgi:hypothetical protein
MSGPFNTGGRSLNSEYNAGRDQRQQTGSARRAHDTMRQRGSDGGLAWHDSRRVGGRRPRDSDASRCRCDHLDMREPTAAPEHVEVGKVDPRDLVHVVDVSVAKSESSAPPRLSSSQHATSKIQDICTSAKRTLENGKSFTFPPFSLSWLTCLGCGHVWENGNGLYLPSRYMPTRKLRMISTYGKERKIRSHKNHY